MSDDGFAGMMLLVGMGALLAGMWVLGGIGWLFIGLSACCIILGVAHNANVQRKRAQAEKLNALRASEDRDERWSH